MFYLHAVMHQLLNNNLCVYIYIYIYTRIYVTGFAKRGLIRAFINTEKSHLLLCISRMHGASFTNFSTNL